MTNSIGRDTKNFPINLMVDEFKIIDRLAFNRGIPTGEFIRRKLRLGISLSNPSEAKRLASIRRARRALVATGILLLNFLFLDGRIPRPHRVSNHRSIRRELEA